MNWFAFTVFVAYAAFTVALCHQLRTPPRHVPASPKRIYVAGPLTKGDMLANVHFAISAGDALLSAGYAPYIPHLSYYWHEQHPHDYEAWMALDFAWLAACDALVRLPGESPGADREVAFAKAHGIPVYDGVDELLWSQDWEGIA